MKKQTLNQIKESYNRLKEGKTGHKLRLLNRVCREMYEGSQDAKNN